MKQLRNSVTLSVLAAAILCSLAHVRGDDLRAGSQGIAVAGIGTVKVRPDQLRIDVQVQGKAEITDDALVKYGDARRRLTEALEKLKLTNLQIKDQAISLSSTTSQAAYMAMMNGGGAQTESTTPIEVSGNVRIELTNLQEQSQEDILKTLGKLLDTIKDAGGNLGPSASDMMAMRYTGRMPVGTTVKFMLHDFTSLREKAYEQAVEDAKVRGRRLANLNGVKLGRVTAVQEVQVAGDALEKSASPYPWYFGDMGQSAGEANEISTNTLGDVPVTVRLMVRFEIADADAPVAAGAGQ